MKHQLLGFLCATALLALPACRKSKKAERQANLHELEKTIEAERAFVDEQCAYNYEEEEIKTTQEETAEELTSDKAKF